MYYNKKYLWEEKYIIMAYKVNAISFNTRHNVNRGLFVKKPVSINTPFKKDSQHVFKNLEISKTSVKFLNFLDKITPYLNKHGNIKKVCLFFGEKLVKYTNKF